MDDAGVIDAVAKGVIAKEPPASPVLPAADPARAMAAIAVYRNNVRAALSRALADTFPVVAALVGDDFFKAMAREFFNAHPPSSPMIVEYARGLPNFIATFSPAATLPYLSDVARLEWTWLEAYRAADAAPIDSDAIIAAGGGDPSALRFDFHPSFRVVTSRFPVASIWRRNRPGGEETPVDMNVGEDVLIIRPDRSVELHVLAPGAATALATLQLGAPITDAFERALSETPEFNPQALFALILSAGIVTGATTEIPTEG